MKRFKFVYVFFILLSLLLLSCSKSQILEIPKDDDDEHAKETFYDREKKREKILDNNDLVLLYSGGAHRSHQWNEDYVLPYVTYIDESGQEHWMFDSFLFLEIHNGNGKAFATGYAKEPANQQDWKKLVDYYFQSSYCLGALNRSIKNAKNRIGNPKEKHKIVIGIPEPIKNQKDWGTLTNGVMLDFSKTTDRINACKWYIDYVRDKFNEFDYDNLELSGFYWIAEEATNSRDILASISSYLNELKYGFIWIPYNGSDGAFQWKQLTFNFAYYQPNYFFSENRPITNLNKACEDAIKYGMDMEMEFDDRALDQNKWGYRLENYMDTFKKYGIWSNNRIAYYQGDKSLYELFNSKNSNDKILYHKFGTFVSERSEQ